MLPAQLFGLLNKGTVVTMATKCNSYQQYSAVFQRLYSSCTKVFFFLFLASILNLLPHLQDPIWYTRWIITETYTTSYVTLTTWIKHTTISQQSTCGIMQITLINVIEIYICGCSGRFSASTIDGKNIGKIFFPLSWYICHKHPYEITSQVLYSCLKQECCVYPLKLIKLSIVRL